jgi:hypothetical protein
MEPVYGGKRREQVLKGKILIPPIPITREHQRLPDLGTLTKPLVHQLEAGFPHNPQVSPLSLPLPREEGAARLSILIPTNFILSVIIPVPSASMGPQTLTQQSQYVIHVLSTNSNLCCYVIKGELEHRTPKSRYTRTSRKHFIKQLTKIERRQTRIRRIRERLKSGSSSGLSPCEDVPASPESHHVIGQMQNLPVDLGVFVRDYIDDPAVKVSICIISVLKNLM